MTAKKYSYNSDHVQNMNDLANAGQFKHRHLSNLCFNLQGSNIFQQGSQLVGCDPVPVTDSKMPGHKNLLIKIRRFHNNQLHFVNV